MIMKDTNGNRRCGALGELFRRAPVFDSECRELFIIPRPNETASEEQGGFTDGKYYYQMFIRRDKATNEADNSAFLSVYDPEKHETVKVSERLFTNHSNDIAYNPYTNELLVVHNNPNRKTVSAFDRDTLQPTRQIKLDCNIFAMDYQPDRHRYLVGVSGAQDFRLLDDDFKPVSPEFKGIPDPLGKITQGCACDDKFIYFILHRDSVINVYDWDGNFVTVIKMNTDRSLEPENISIVDGRIYAGCGGGKPAGMHVFEVTPKLP